MEGDKLPLEISLQPSDPGYEGKMKMLSAKGSLSRTFKLGVGDEKVPGLIDWVRFLWFSKEIPLEKFEISIWENLLSIFETKLSTLPKLN